jgi:hypothetical protein
LTIFHTFCWRFSCLCKIPSLQKLS